MSEPRPLPPQFTRQPPASVCRDGHAHRRLITLDERHEATTGHADKLVAARRYVVVRVAYCLDCHRHLRAETAPQPFGPWQDAPAGALDVNASARDRRAG